MKNNDTIMLNTYFAFPQFERILMRIKKSHNLQYAIDDLAHEYTTDSGDEFSILLPNALETELLGLLSYLFDDEANDWIGYWIYELGFGERYCEGQVIDKDGQNIVLKTARDLWDFLTEEGSVTYEKPREDR